MLRLEKLKLWNCDREVNYVATNKVYSENHNCRGRWGSKLQFFQNSPPISLYIDPPFIVTFYLKTNPRTHFLLTTAHFRKTIRKLRFGILGGWEFSSYKIELQNRVTENDVTSHFQLLTQNFLHIFFLQVTKLDIHRKILNFT